MSVPAPRYYVYVLARPDGSPFYVGKGQGKRITVHEYEARTGHRCHKCNVIRKIWNEGGKVHRSILLRTDDEQEAYEYERTVIALYGRDSLANYTDGAEGSTGRVYSSAERKQRSINSRRMWSRAEYRARHRAGLRVRYSQPEARAIQAANTKRTWEDAEIRAKRSTGIKGAWQDPGYRDRMIALRQSYGDSPEFRAKCSELMKAYLATPEGRKQRSTTMRQLWATDEYQAKVSAGRKLMWQDPEYRAKQSASRKAAWARRKAKQSEDQTSLV